MSKVKKVVIATGIVAIALVGGSTLMDTQSKEVQLAGSPDGKLVSVDTAEIADIQTRIASTGMVFSKESEHLLAESNTTVETIHVEVGDIVKKGDTLVTFEKEARESIEREIQSLELRLESAKLNLSQSVNASTSQVMQMEQSILAAEQNKIRAEEELNTFSSNYVIVEKSYQTANNQFEAVKELFESGLASKQELDQAEQSYLQAKDSLDSLKTQEALLQKSLEAAIKQHETATYDKDVLINAVEDTSKQERIQVQENDIQSLELQKETLFDQLEKATLVVTAPIDGVVATISAKEGLPVAVGNEMMSIIDPSELIVKAEVSPYYAAQLTEGLAVQIKYNGSTTIETSGVVEMVSPVAVQKSSQSAQSTVTTAIPVEITIDDITGLKEGLTVDLKIITEDVKGAVAVPLLATMEDKDNNSYVYVVEEGSLEKRYVKQGAANNQLVQVSDVEEGELVVTNPTEALEEGTQVSYLPLEEAGDSQ